MHITNTENRGDRALQLARAHLQPLLGTLFNSAAAGDILALQAGLADYDQRIASATPVSTAGQAWKVASSACAAGTATPDQERIAAHSKEGFKRYAEGRMHSLKAARADARKRMRRLLASSFASPAPALGELADKIEASWRAWWATWNLPADPCPLAEELRALADAGWEWAEESSPLIERGQLAKLLRV